MPVGLHYWTGTIWIAARGSVLGEAEVKVTSLDPSVEVHQATPGDLTAGLYGWDGEAWVKVLNDSSGHLQVDVLTALATVTPATDHVFIAYKDTVFERVSIATAPAGNNDLDGTAVPSGEIHVIQAVSLKDSTSVPAALELHIVRGGNTYVLFANYSPNADEHSFWAGHVVLEEGDFVRGIVLGATLNDALILTYQGYKFDAP